MQCQFFQCCLNSSTPTTQSTDYHHVHVFSECSIRLSFTHEWDTIWDFSKCRSFRCEFTSFCFPAFNSFILWEPLQIENPITITIKSCDALRHMHSWKYECACVLRSMDTITTRKVLDNLLCVLKNMKNVLTEKLSNVQQMWRIYVVLNIEMKNMETCAGSKCMLIDKVLVILDEKIEKLAGILGI